MKTFWIVLYNVVLAVTHMCGVYFAVAVCFVRGKFYYQWTAFEDVLLWLLLAAVVGIHYLLIFWGHKRNAVYGITYKILQIYEKIIGVILLGILLYVVDSFEEVMRALPIVAFGVAMLTLRYLWMKKSCGTGDGSVC